VSLDDINDVFAGLRAGTLRGRAVLDMTGAAAGAARASKAELTA
jgi:hypothetical protein